MSDVAFSTARSLPGLSGPELNKVTLTGRSTEAVAVPEAEQARARQALQREGARAEVSTALLRPQVSRPGTDLSSLGVRCSQSSAQALGKSTAFTSFYLGLLHSAETLARAEHSEVKLDTGEILNFLQECYKGSSAADSALLDVTFASFAAAELERQNAGPGSDQTRLEILNTLLEAASSSDPERLTQLQQIFNEQCRQLPRQDGNIITAVNDSLAQKIELSSKLQTAAQHDEAVFKSKNQTVAQTLQQLGRLEIELTTELGSGAVQGQLQQIQERRLQFALGAVSGHEIRLQDACNSPALADQLPALTQHSQALKQDFLAQIYDQADICTIGEMEKLIGERALYELLDADREEVLQAAGRMKSLLLESFAEGVKSFDGSVSQRAGTDSAAAAALFAVGQGVNFNLDTLASLNAKIPGVLTQIVNIALSGKAEDGCRLADNLLYACREEPELREAAGRLCAAAGFQDADGRVSRQIEARCSFIQGILSLQATAAALNIPELKVSSAEDLQKLDSAKMTALIQKINDPKAQGAYAELNSTLGLTCISLAFDAYCAEHPGTNRDISANRDFQQTVGLDLKDFNSRLLNNRTQALAQAAVLHGFRLNPQRLGLTLMVAELDPQAAAAQHREQQLRGALAALAGMNTQGHFLDNMDRAVLIRLAGSRLPEALKDGSFKTQEEVRGFLTRPDASGVRNSRDAAALQAAFKAAQVDEENFAKVRELQGVNKDSEVLGETLAVSLACIQDLTAEDAGDLSPGQLQRLGIDPVQWEAAQGPGEENTTRRIALAQTALQAQPFRAGEYEYQLLAQSFVNDMQKLNPAAQRSQLDILNMLAGSPGGLLPADVEKLDAALQRRAGRSAADKMQALVSLDVLKPSGLNVNLQTFKTRSLGGRKDFADLQQILKNAGKSGDPALTLQHFKTAFDAKMQAGGRDLLALASGVIAGKFHTGSDTAGNIKRALQDKAGLSLKTALGAELQSDIQNRFLHSSGSRQKTADALGRIDSYQDTRLGGLMAGNNLDYLIVAAAELAAGADSLQQYSFADAAAMAEAYGKGTAAQRAEIEEAIASVLQEQFGLDAAAAQVMQRRVLDRYTQGDPSAREYLKPVSDQLTSSLRPIKTSLSESSIYEAAVNLYPQLLAQAQNLQTGQALQFNMENGAEVSVDLIPDAISLSGGLNVKSGAAIARSENGYEVRLSVGGGVKVGVSAEAGLGDGVNVEAELGVNGGGSGEITLTFDNADDAALYLAHAMCGLADPRYAGRCHAEALAVCGKTSGGISAQLSAKLGSEENSFADIFEIGASIEATGNWDFAKSVGSEGNSYTWNTKLAVNAQVGIEFNTDNHIGEGLVNSSNIIPLDEAQELGREGLKAEKSFSFEREVGIETGRGGYPIESGVISYKLTGSVSVRQLTAFCRQFNLPEAEQQQILNIFNAAKAAGEELGGIALKAEFDFKGSGIFEVSKAKAHMQQCEQRGRLHPTAVEFTANDEQVKHNLKLSIASMVEISSERSVGIENTRVLNLGRTAQQVPALGG